MWRDAKTWIISNRAKGTVAGESVLYIWSISSLVSLECRMLDGTVDEMSWLGKVVSEKNEYMKTYLVHTTNKSLYIAEALHEYWNLFISTEYNITLKDM